MQCDIKLISQTKSVNEYGDITVTETERTVFAEVKSIGQTEFYQGMAAGLKPEIKFVLSNFLEYQGELIVEYTAFAETTAHRYTVIRTYTNGESIEITCKRGVTEDERT